MERIGIARVAFVLAALLLVGLASAQDASFRAAFINSQYLLTLHPVYPELVALQERARVDVAGLNQRAQELVAKREAGGTLTPDEQDVLNITLTTLDAVTARYDAEIGARLEPAFADITRAVSATAEALGVTMVFDYIPARDLGVIVYAHADTDITNQVAERLTGGE